MSTHYADFAAEARRSLDYWSAIPMHEFAAEVANLMEEMNVSRKDLSRRTGFTRSYISKILSGDANFTIKTMSQILAVFGKELHLQAIDQGSFYWFPIRRSGTLKLTSSYGLEVGTHTVDAGENLGLQAETKWNAEAGWGQLTPVEATSASANDNREGQGASDPVAA